MFQLNKMIFILCLIIFNFVLRHKAEQINKAGKDFFNMKICGRFLYCCLFAQKSTVSNSYELSKVQFNFFVSKAEFIRWSKNYLKVSFN